MITQLVLGGFQVFRERTVVPLGPLTLLYGPNSAGKSTILDAWQALQKLTKVGSSARDLYGDIAVHPLLYWGPEILRRHWHMSPAGADQSQVPLVLGVTARTGFDGLPPSDSSQDFRVPSFNDFCSHLRPLVNEDAFDMGVEFEFQRPISDRTAADGRRTLPSGLMLTLHLMGEPALMLVSAASGRPPRVDFSLNFANPLVASILSLQDAESFVQTEPDRFRIDSGWLQIDDVSLSLFWISLDRDRGPRLSRSRDTALSVIGKLEELLMLVLQGAMYAINGLLSVRAVSASRVIPSASQMTYLIDDRPGDAEHRFPGLHVAGIDEYFAFAGDGRSDFPDREYLLRDGSWKSLAELS